MKYALLLFFFVIVSSCNLESIKIPSEQTSKASTENLEQSASSNPITLSKRVALVIGNAAYQDSPLKNPVNDAKDMAEVLNNLGFDVILKTDVNLRTMVNAVRDFEERLTNKSVGLFYFSGHGNQYEGENYLIPLQAQIEEGDDFPREALRASGVLEKIENKNREGVNLVFLDACRNNPYGGKGFKSGGGSKGLTLMGSSAKGSLIAYATAPGTVASDNPEEQNSIYTKHLLSALKEIAQENILTLLTKVRQRVYKETQGKQLPKEENALMVVEFCLALEGCEKPQTSPLEVKRPLEKELESPHVPRDLDIPIATIYFNFGDYHVQPVEKAKIKGIIGFLRDYPVFALKLVGYADTVGNEERNILLAERRNSAVIEALRQQGLPTGTVVSVAFGEATGPDETKNQENRRVEISPYISLTF